MGVQKSDALTKAKAIIDVRRLSTPTKAPAMPTATNPILVDVMRGGIVESVHRGALVVSDALGHTFLAMGDTQRPVFPRSAVKILQALPLVASGAADHWGLSDEALALACASHNGEDLHAATALRTLHQAGLDDGDLACGAHAPYFALAANALAVRGQAPCALHNNCSGKHAGLLGLAAFRALRDPQVSTQGYEQASHPVMREVTQAMGDAMHVDLSHSAYGIDGCSIPTFAVPLTAMALAFARVASGTGLSAAHAQAAQRLRGAIARAPFMVGGTDRFDTDVMHRLGARVCCKVGAEGVYCAALPEQGLGVALKMDDGNNARAAEVVMAALIERFVTLSPEELTFMQSKSTVRLRNWRGLDVGTLQPSTVLGDHLSQGAQP
jgi:L-asparaginase II